MAKLVHEIWFAADGLPSCVLAGPMGDSARKLIAEAGPRRLLRRFVAESHFEAMTIYNRILGRGPYETDFLAQDAAPYPDAWRDAQEAAGVMAEDVAPELGPDA
jgi:hypothetical protein